MALTSGTRLGAYEIKAPLGRGGVGEVYRAWDPRLEREVALKILRERTETDPDRVRRFVAEARAASALNHPNIIAVFDAAVDGQTPYIVSELIDGDSLRAELRRGPLAAKRLLDLATQIADGLADAHAAGIVHRDLKPENIMVTSAGRAKILDFGLARTSGLQAGGEIPAHLDNQTQTASGLLIGTVPYMSPEQARGTAADFHSDQFSFGLVLYEMATGAAAFRRDTPAQTLDAIINEEATPLPDVNRQVPLVLWWIIERCLAKNPRDRYASTMDLHRDLRTLRDRLADAIARERRSAPADAVPQSRARRLLSTGALLFGTVAFGLALWLLLVTPASLDQSSLRFTPFATEAGYEGLPAWSPDGQTIAYSAEVNGVLQIFTRSLSASAPAQVTDAAFDCKFPFWSPDGKRIYYVSMAKTRDSIWSVGAAGGTPQVVVQNATRGAISPDGRTLAFLRDEERADIVGTALLYFVTPPRAEPWSADDVEKATRRYSEAAFASLRLVEGAVAFSPDGRWLGVAGVPLRSLPVPIDPFQRGWQLWLVPMRPGDSVRRLAQSLDPFPRVTGLTWLDDRHVLFGLTVAATPGSHLWMADVERDQVWPLTRSADHESFPSALPGGGRAVFTTGESDYDLFELSTDGSSPQPLLATARRETDPAWSPDGSVIAYVTDRGGADQIWLRNRVGQPFDRPVITGRDVGDGQDYLLAAPTFSPDGQSIAYLRNAHAPIFPLQIYTARTAGGPAVRLLPPSHDSFQGAPTWAPDGQWVAFAEWKGEQWELVKMRVGSGEDATVLRTDGIANANPHWSPKGDWITWETEEGFLLVSADGKTERAFESEQWLVHGWSPDGLSILGITEGEDLRLSLISIDIKSGRSRVLADLGPSPPVNNPVQGFSVSPDGTRILTSFVRMRGDLWLLEGLGRRESLWRRFFQ